MTALVMAMGASDAAKSNSTILSNPKSRWPHTDSDIPTVNLKTVTTNSKNAAKTSRLRVVLKTSADLK
jgi:hypothetical protein